MGVALGSRQMPMLQSRLSVCDLRDSWAFILLEPAQGSSRKGTLWVIWSVYWDRAGVLCRTREVFWWLSEASRCLICVPACLFITY